MCGAPGPSRPTESSEAAQAQGHPMRQLLLDFTQNLPGPYATLVLASLGADVVKIEPPGGDTARMTPRLFAIVNAGKRSCVIDLKQDGAAATIAKLFASADVVVEGFRPGVMAKLGAVPTLLIYGDADPNASPPVGRLFNRTIPNSELVILNECGHSGYWERPALFNAAVLEFMKRRGA